MRHLAAILVIGSAALAAQPVLAADAIIPYPEPPVVYPEVDHGLEGSFYLRGSVAGNAMWAHRVNHPDFDPDSYDISEWGYGYSAGIGAGFETGDGWRADVTVDYFQNEGMAIDVPAGTVFTDGTPGGPAAGRYSLNLRSTIGLANVYYDFGMGGQGLSAAGGAFGYVGAGIGVAYNEFNTSEPGGVSGPYGSNLSLAAAGMAGVGYDFGSVVADLGYRALYINRLENNSAAYEYTVENLLAHEVRGTVRYRF